MVRLAEQKDLEAIEEIYRAARQYMKETGNPTQWGNTHPAREMLEEDIFLRRLYVVEENCVIHGVFALIFGEEPTYSCIENGTWLNEEPYATIHRVAGDGVTKGIFGQCLEFCRSKCSNLRIDTHHDNHTMQHLIEKNGFVRCGIIYVEDGTPRIAYQIP